MPADGPAAISRLHFGPNFNPKQDPHRATVSLLPVMAYLERSRLASSKSSIRGRAPGIAPEVS